jgi:hypothetical protein
MPAAPLYRRPAAILRVFQVLKRRQPTEQRRRFAKAGVAPGSARA